MGESRSFLAGIGASFALVAAGTLALLAASAIVAFHGWPGGGGAGGAPLALHAQAVRAPGRVLVPAASRRAGRTVARHGASAAPRPAAPRTPALTPHRASRTVVTAPATATTPAGAAPPAPAPRAPSAPAATPSPVVVPKQVPVPVPVPAPVPAPVAGPVDQAAEVVASAPGQVADAVAGAVPRPQVAAGDPR